MQEKNSFIFYTEWRDCFAILSPEDQSRLLMALIDYQTTGEVPQLEGAVLMAFTFIRKPMDQNRKKYENTCKRNQANGGKGGRPPKTRQLEELETQTDTVQETAEKPKETEWVSSEPKKADYDSDNEDDNDKDKRTPPISPKGEKQPKAAQSAQVTEMFAEFWYAYPRKVAKGDALKAFRRLKPESDLLVAMLAALEQQKKSDQWIKDGGSFIPNPATWLNGRRWEDELPVKPKAKGDRSFEVSSFDAQALQDRILQDFMRGEAP